MIHSSAFNIQLDNIPLINLRMEFNAYYALLRSDGFRSQFGGEIKPIKTPYLTWFGMPEAFFTLVIQRAISGVEAYLPGAVFLEMGMAGRLNAENKQCVKNPWLLGGRSVIENYYHRLPSMLREEISLKQYDNSLWEKNSKFYSEIRNPIFHGYQFSRVNLGGISKVYEHMACLYDWIDSWHFPEKLVKGGSALSRTRKNFAAS